jgi:hypothetical protein
MAKVTLLVCTFGLAASKCETGAPKDWRCGTDPDRVGAIESRHAAAIMAMPAIRRGTYRRI